jgi:hypothetical protein
MPRPKDKLGIRRFIGLGQYLAKFIPNLSDIDDPLQILLKSEEQRTRGKLHKAKNSMQ